MSPLIRGCVIPVGMCQVFGVSHIDRMPETEICHIWLHRHCCHASVNPHVWYLLKTLDLYMGWLKHWKYLWICVCIGWVFKQYQVTLFFHYATELVWMLKGNLKKIIKKLFKFCEEFGNAHLKVWATQTRNRTELTHQSPSFLWVISAANTQR